MVRQTHYVEGNILLAMTEADWREARGDDLEWCEECGPVLRSREPDLRRYECEACARRTVFGAEDSEEWVANGWLELLELPTEPTDEDFETVSYVRGAARSAMAPVHRCAARIRKPPFRPMRP